NFLSKYDVGVIPPIVLPVYSESSVTAYSGFAHGGSGTVYEQFVPNDGWDETTVTFATAPMPAMPNNIVDNIGSWWVWYGFPSLAVAHNNAATMGISNEGNKPLSNLNTLLNQQVVIERGGDQTLSMYHFCRHYDSRYYAKNYKTDETLLPHLKVVYSYNYDVTCTYSWVGPGGFTATTKDISNLTLSGLYTLTITSPFGCIGVMNANIIVPPGTLDIDPLSNVNVCDSYVLPVITGTSLTGGQAYFSGSSGTGTQYTDGDVILVPMTMYIYDETGTIPNCFDEESFSITIDNTAPLINCPGNLTAVCSIAEQSAYVDLVAFVAAGGSASDETSLNNVSFILLSEVSDGATCPEVVTRTYQIEDDCGHFSTCQQTITINDTQAPTATAPAAVLVECIGDVPVDDILLITDEADNCTVAPVVAFVGDVSDGLTCPETITRTYSITDDCGNVTTVDQIITVDDITNPTATNPASQVGLPPVFDPLQVTDEADNCGVPIVTDGGDVSDGGNCPEIITRTYIITDACGNFITVEQTFTIGDAIMPTASNPLPMNVECIADVVAPDVTVVTDEVDNGGAPVVTWEDDTSDGNTCAEVILRRYRVTDNCGNFIFVTQTITVLDITIPVMDATPADLA
ncbi:MAG: hypothetical protein HRT57_13030, partial [Crocinitomicaceae bacterium]|nr:hypothetical protein [Crocinitomicaceae bacterium]